MEPSSSETRPQSSELFICFTSRLSSSSMKLSSSKSANILSPARQLSLSSSLSRRLRSGSLKGAASPMFPAGKKRSGAASFDTPEPSSPKVTCIGQVRVKTKLQAAKSRSKKKKKITRSRSSFSAGEASFRRVAAAAAEQESQNGNANKYWVHTLRELNCFMPCGSSCAKDRERKRSPEESSRSGDRARSCGAVFARWLVSVQDGEGKGREIELVVGEDEEEEKRVVEVRSGSQRRRVFEGIEFKDLEAMAAREEALGGGGKEEAARVSLCVPPKNALLLMRCRSDPVKMAALTSKFWESPAPKKDNGENADDDSDIKEQESGKAVEVAAGRASVSEAVEVAVGRASVSEAVEVAVGRASVSEATELALELETIEDCLDVEDEESSVAVGDEGNAEDCEEAEVVRVDDQEAKESGDDEQRGTEFHTDLDAMQADDAMEEIDFSAAEATGNSDILQVEEAESSLVECGLQGRELLEHEEETEKESGPENISPDSKQVEEPAEQTRDEEEEEEERVNAECMVEVEDQRLSTEPETVGHADPAPVPVQVPKAEIRESKGLPDCLLMMMCEPKLSMEVSKETWVCTTDFIRWLPERRRPPVNNQKPAPQQPEKTRPTAPPKPPIKNALPIPARQQVLQPPRSSCSFPAAASAVERKLASYEPSALTRCKSEPMRTATKLAAVAAAPAPEASSCFWKNRKLEQQHHHRPPTVGVGGRGGTAVGF